MRTLVKVNVHTDDPATADKLKEQIGKALEDTVRDVESVSTLEWKQTIHSTAYMENLDSLESFQQRFIAKPKSSPTAKRKAAR